MRPVANPPNPWASTHVEYLEEAPDAELEVYEETARSILAENDSPDVPFRYSANPYRGCIHACAYCLAGDTLISMADSSVKRLADVRAGDKILGTRMEGRYRRFVETTVLAHWATVKPAWEVRLRDGTVLIASGDHRFLTERGWKYVADEVRDGKGRAHLTTNNSLLGLGARAAAVEPTRDEDYRRGYVTGMVRGDGMIGCWSYPQRAGRGGKRQYQFRLALIDLPGLHRARAYLDGFGVATREYLFAEARPRYAAVHAIRTHASTAVFAIDELIAWPLCPTESWSRGFLAGIFDAEGSFSRGILRIANTDPAINERVIEALSRFGFDVELEQKNAESGAPERQTGVRVRGGVAAAMRFFAIACPAVRRKCSITGTALKSKAPLDVLEVRRLGFDLPMFDITTGTEDFIANGVVSHNCYARPTHQYLGYGAGTDFDRKIVVKTNAAALLRAAFDKRSWQGDWVNFSGVTDCYQPLEASYRVTRACLEVCAEYRNPVGIITKSALVRRDVDLLQQLTREAEAWVFLSIPFADEETARAVEPFAAPLRRRFETVEALSKAGVFVGVSLAPMIPGLNDSDMPAILRRARDAGARAAFTQLVRLPREVLPVFDARMEEAFPLRVARIRNGLREMRGGDPGAHTRFGERMRGSGSRWEAARALFELERKRLGLDAKIEVRASTFRRPTKQGSLF